MPREVRTLEFDFSDIHVREEEIYRMLGYPEGFTPDGLAEACHEMIQEAPEHFRIRGGYVVHDISTLDIPKGIIGIEGEIFSPGKLLCRNLKNSQSAIFFLFTAGPGVREWTNETMKHDPVKGYMIDILGSIAADTAVDLLERHLEIDERLNITNRYSPGYCGWKLDEQQKIFKLFPDRFCDIILTPSCLMLPVKSVSGIIGYGEKVQKMAYECEICDSHDCVYRGLRRAFSEF